jgi:hypothetical protein
VPAVSRFRWHLKQPGLEVLYFHFFDSDQTSCPKRQVATEAVAGHTGEDIQKPEADRTKNL